MPIDFQSDQVICDVCGEYDYDCECGVDCRALLAKLWRTKVSRRSVDLRDHLENFYPDALTNAEKAELDALAKEATE